MIIEDVLKKVDDSKKNKYSNFLKVSWINELEGRIKTRVIKEYVITQKTLTEETSFFELPDGVNFNDIEKIFYDGKEIPKLDLRSYGTAIEVNATLPVTVKIVYKKKHIPYRYVEHISRENDITIANNVITTAGDAFKDLKVGDLIKISGSVDSRNNDISLSISAISADNKSLTVSGVYNTTETGQVTITRVLNDILLLENPDDALYELWIKAKIDFENREYNNYNNTMQMFNAVWDDFVNNYKSNSPVDNSATVRNIWG